MEKGSLETALTEPIAKGSEYAVYHHGDSLVKKIPLKDDIDEGSPFKSSKFRAFCMSETHAREQEVDCAIAKECFGQYFPETTINYIPESDRQNGISYFIIQESLGSDALSLEDVIGRGTHLEVRERMVQYRRDFLGILWSSKRYLELTDVPFDLHLENILIDQYGRLKVADFGMPTTNMEMLQNAEYAGGIFTEKERADVANILNARLQTLIDMEQMMQVTQEEKYLLDQEYGIPEDFGRRRINGKRTELKEIEQRLRGRWRLRESEA